MANPILLYTSIFSETAVDFTTQVLDTPKTEKLKVWINTPGGSTSHGFAMMAAMQEHGGESEMTVTGDANSFGFFMLLSGGFNIAYDTSNFLVHRAASFWEDFMSEEELKDVENRNKIIRKKMEARIDENIFEEVTGKTFDDIFNMETRLDVRLDAKQAKKIGLIDKIVKLDVRKKADIESRYFHDIAALAEPQNSNNNPNSNNMGLFSKDPVLLCKIGENQYVYSKLEKGAKIKAIGEGEKDPVTGTFEANEKKVTVINNEITAIEDIDNKQKSIDALTAKVTELTALVGEITKKAVVETDKPDKSQEQINALTDKVAALTAILDKAKITTSKPKLPKGEFKEDKPANSETPEKKKRKIQKNIDAVAKGKAEAFSKYQNNREV